MMYVVHIIYHIHQLLNKKLFTFKTKENNNIELFQKLWKKWFYKYLDLI